MPAKTDTCDLCVSVNARKATDSVNLIIDRRSYDVNLCSRHFAVVSTMFAPVVKPRSSAATWVRSGEVRPVGRPPKSEAAKKAAKKSAKQTAKRATKKSTKNTSVKKAAKKSAAVKKAVASSNRKGRPVRRTRKASGRAVRVPQPTFSA